MSWQELIGFVAALATVAFIFWTVREP